MKRTDLLAHAAVLALAGYAVRQLVSDVRALRYVDARLDAPRVLSWSEAVARMGIETTPWQDTYIDAVQVQAALDAPRFVPPSAPMANAMMTRPRDWTSRQASLIFTANEIARDAELVVARIRARQALRTRRW